MPGCQTEWQRWAWVRVKWKMSDKECNFVETIKRWKWLIILGVVVSLITGYHLYDRTMGVRGSLAWIHFSTLKELVFSKMQVAFVEATGSEFEYNRNESGVSQNGGLAELDWRQELWPREKPASTEKLQAIIDKVQPELMDLISSQQKELRWFYPEIQMNITFSIIDGKGFGRPAILLTLRFTTNPSKHT
jgi:hypothetical protein